MCVGGIHVRLFHANLPKFILGIFLQSNEVLLLLFLSQALLSCKLSHPFYHSSFSRHSWAPNYFKDISNKLLGCCLKLAFFVWEIR